MKAGVQWSTFVVPTILACVARGIRAGVTFVGAATRDFRKGRSSTGNLICSHSFRGRAAKKKNNTVLPRKFRRLRRLQRFLLKDRDFASAVLWKKR